MAEESDAGRPAVTGKAAEAAPAATVTFAGTVAVEVRELVRVTTAPLGGARPFNEAVPVAVLPPWTVIGARVRDESVAGVTVRFAVFVVPESVAETVTDVEEGTPSVLTENWIDVLPAATTMVAGTVAAPELELVRLTVEPPGGAAAPRITVPVVAVPDRTLVGLRVSELTVTGVTVNVANFVAPDIVPDTVTAVEEATAKVVTVNVLVLEPAGTVTLPGTVAMAEFEVDIATVLPPEGALAESLTVPVAVFPPITDVGLTLTELRLWATAG